MENVTMSQSEIATAVPANGTMFTTNPIYSMVRTCDIIVPNKPQGWYVRERFDPETDKSITLELGCWVNPEVFMGVPCNYSMKYLFTRTNITVEGEENTRYYQVPMNTDFAVSKFTSKKTGFENPILVKPDDRHPAVMPICGAFASRTMILDMQFSDNVKILRQFLDKQRQYVAFIAFIENDNPEATITIAEGIPNTNFMTTRKIKVTVNGANEETDKVDSTEKVNTKFIAMPMWIAKPKKEDAPKTTEAATDAPTKADISDKGDEYPKKKFNGNRNFNKNYRNDRQSNDQNQQQRNYKNGQSRYDKNKQFKNRNRNRNYDN